MSTKGKEVKGITQEQRYYLCLKKHECPLMKQSELAEWFKQKYDRAISQPTISHTLKQKDIVLHRGLNAPGMSSAKLRNRSVKHPHFERALYQWYLSLSKDESDALTGPMLIEKAKQLSLDMQIREPQVFCNGWLSRFRARYSIKTGRRREDGGGGSGGSGGGGGDNTQPLFINAANNATLTPSSLPSSTSSSTLMAPTDSGLNTVAISFRSMAAPDAALSSRLQEQEYEDAGSRVKRQKTSRHSSQQPEPPLPQDTTPAFATVPTSSSPSSSKPALSLEAPDNSKDSYHLAISTVETGTTIATVEPKEALEMTSPGRTTGTGRPSQLQCENQLHMELLRSLPLDPSPVPCRREGEDDTTSKPATASTQPTATPTAMSWSHTAPLHDDSILAQIAAHTHDTSRSSPTPVISIVVTNGGATSVSAATLSEAPTATTLQSEVDQAVETARSKLSKSDKVSAEDARACLDSIRAFVGQHHEAPSLPASEGEGNEKPKSPLNHERAYQLLLELQAVLNV